MADRSENFKLTINKEFAKKFEKNKQRTELEQLKAKYGEDDFTSDSSSSETEDEDAKELTAQKEKEFLTVLSLLKKKDPKIYDKDVNFYENENSSEDEQEIKEKPKKPVYLKDYERERLLEKGSKAFVSDEETDETSDEKDSKDLTYNEEQKVLRDSFKIAVVESDDEDGGFLSLRQKSKEEKQKEDSDYKEWLKGVKKSHAKEDADLETLQQFWNDPCLDQDEQFLRNYILERGYVDRDETRIPTYNEIVNDEKEDEEELEKQEEFERKYNFRFEEPDAEFIKTYPRTVNSSVRQKSDKRKEARKKREDRKKKEKEQKREELKRLKNLKKKEIQEKLEKLKEITGNPNVGFTEEDMEGDFDPKKYDAIMEKVFSEGYYEEEEGEKPTFNDGLDLEEEENWDEWEGPSHVGNHVNEEQDYDGNDEQYDDYYYEDGNFNMDADYDPSMEIPKTKRNRNKRSSKLSQALNKQKPLFDPNEKTFEEYFDEYYKLDYEDIIGDLPCRFKYRNVLPNDYGLSTEEVLSYPERALNQWVSVKRMSQYRSDQEERRDAKKFRKLAKDERRKRRTFSSLATLSEQRTEEKNENRATRTSQKQPNIDKNSEETKVPHEEQKTNKRLQQKPEDRVLKKEKQKSLLLRRKGWKRRPTQKEAKDIEQKKKLARQFKGAKKEKLAGLSVGRLAAYGLKKKKKVSD